MNFSCSSCGYASETRENVVRHLNKKNKCGDNPVLEIINVDIECEFCNKKLSTKYSLSRHLNVCKVKKSNLEKELAIKDKKLAEMEKKLAIAEALAKKPTIGTQNNIIVQLTPWNDPSTKNIEQYYKEAIKKLVLSIPTIIERVHFNDKLPENHNILIKNYRSKVAKVFNGQEWKTIDQDRLLDELVNTYEVDLENWAEENPDQQHYIDKYNKIKNRDGEENVINDVKTEVKRMIYDKCSNKN
jgi:hypothetical protein